MINLQRGEPMRTAQILKGLKVNRETLRLMDSDLRQAAGGGSTLSQCRRSGGPCTTRAFPGFTLET
jgi:hypothetical protein